MLCDKEWVVRVAVCRMSVRRVSGPVLTVDAHEAAAGRARGEECFFIFVK